MSTFEVLIRRIAVIEDHPNADKLELVQIGGYRAVVAKGVHQLNDFILYVPTDSVFTNLQVAERLHIASYLTGKYKNRVKPIRLRGIVSEGIVLPWREVSDFLTDTGKVPPLENFYEGLDLARLLEIEKYEEPIPIEMTGHVRPWPSFLPHYDVENIKRPESLESVIVGEEIVMTEKLHGTNISIAIGPGLDEGEDAFVCSRRLAIKRSDTNVYWRAALKYDLITKLTEYTNLIRKFAAYDLFGNPYDVRKLPIKEADAVIESLSTALEDRSSPTVSIHGEVVGVQDLKYGYTNGDVGFYAFDIMVNGEYLDYDEFVIACQYYGIPMVPELYRGPYDYAALEKAAQGPTVVGDTHIREGGVIRPVKERRDRNGRVQYKFISDAYLLRKGGTELH